MYSVILKKGSQDVLERYRGHIGEIVQNTHTGDLHVMDGEQEGGLFIVPRCKEITQPTMYLPSDGKVDVPISPLLATYPYEGGNKFRSLQFSIALDPDFNEVVYLSKFIEDISCQHDTSVVGLKLVGGVKHYVKSRHLDDLGILSEWSPVTSFITCME